MRHRAAALFSSVLVAIAIVALPAPARAVVEGVEVRITQLPGEFEAGADARTVEVVASTERRAGERRCRKVRWSMVLRVDGMDLDQVEVDRIEDDGSFPLRRNTDGDTARLTDVRLDPGQLCPGRTVTARYRVAVDDEAPAGRVTFHAQAFGADDRLLQAASGSSRVVGEEPEETRSPSPSASPSESAGAAGDEPSAEAAAPPGADTTGPDLSATAGTGGTPSLLGPGLIVGAVLVFLGVGLLLRIRLRNRNARHSRRPTPTSFYPAP